MIRVDAWQPAGGSFQDISLTSDYQGMFVDEDTLAYAASAQFEDAAATSGYLRGVMATTQELPVVISRKPGGAVNSQTFHTNIRSWFSPYETARATGYLRVLWEDGATQLRIPCRVLSLSTIPRRLDAYRVVLKAEQPMFEATTETSHTSSPASNAGNVRCGVTLELGGATIASSHGTASGEFAGHLRRIDINRTVTSNSRLLVNGVPTPWREAGSQHIEGIVTGDDPTIEWITGLSTNDALRDTFTAGQLASTGSNSTYVYSDLRVSTMLNDSRLGGLWRPVLFLPSSWPEPANGWGYYIEDTADGWKMYLNDSPSFGTAGAYRYNAVYLDSGGANISSISGWDIVKAGFTSAEAAAVLLGRRAGADAWEILYTSDTNASATVGPSTGSNLRELLWTIMPLTDTLTTDPSLELNPDTATALAFGSNPNLSLSTTRYSRLHGAFTNSTTGQSITFTDVVMREANASPDLIVAMPSRRVDWDIAVQQSGLVYGAIEMSDADRGLELAPGSNTISNGTGGTYTLKHRSGYA